MAGRLTKSQRAAQVRAQERTIRERKAKAAKDRRKRAKLLKPKKIKKTTSDGKKEAGLSTRVIKAGPATATYTTKGGVKKKTTVKGPKFTAFRAGGKRKRVTRVTRARKIK